MSTRGQLSDKVRALVNGEVQAPMSPLDSWLYRRRVEWAAQLAFAKAHEGVEPHASLADVLNWLLVHSWESDGCVALWNHAERGGKPHPESASENRVSRMAAS